MADEVAYNDRFNSVRAMADSVFFGGATSRQRYSRFWLLLILAAAIASAGVVGDSTATVIGAMIVAPLMTPIMGTMLATVIGDRSNLIRSLLLVIAGAGAAIAVGYIVGLLVVNSVLADTNSQVASRVSPRLIDLLAALATGVVGSVALVRKDISDTLPGVAIAISLVPPLTVVGLTLESGSIGEALGALLLFATNVVAIIGTGIVVMSMYGVTRLAQSEARIHRSLRKPIALLTVMFVIIGIPLALTSVTVATQAVQQQKIQSVAQGWAADSGWTLTSVYSQGTEIHIEVEGPLPSPNTDSLKTGLSSSGIDLGNVMVDMTPVQTVKLSG